MTPDFHAYRWLLANISGGKDSQTMLRHLVNIYDCRLGFPASVRYDPHNPGNSLIVAESWSGLRDTANSVPLHGRPSAAASSAR